MARQGEEKFRFLDSVHGEEGALEKRLITWKEKGPQEFYHELSPVPSRITNPRLRR